MRLTILTVVAFSFPMIATIQAGGANDPQAIQKNVNSNFACTDIQKATQKLPVFAMNIANKDTTRTPEGGPYKRVDINCRDQYCETSAKADFKTMYAPTHPDANSSGYLQVPTIDVANEYASLTAAAAETRLLAENGTCGASALGNASMAFIKYGAASYVQTDTFAYASDGHLSAWTRTLKDGTSKSYAFSTDGTIVK